MKNLRNQIQLIGRLGANPEVKTFGENRKVAHFILATNESYRNAMGEKVNETQWHKIVCWDKQAAHAEKWLAKGQQIVVVGKLSTRTYDNKKGEKQFVTEVVANDVLLLSKKENQ